MYNLSIEAPPGITGGRFFCGEKAEAKVKAKAEAKAKN
jgi:hypothetical protein